MAACWMLEFYNKSIITCLSTQLWLRSQPKAFLSNVQVLVLPDHTCIEGKTDVTCTVCLARSSHDKQLQVHVFGHSYNTIKMKTMEWIVQLTGSLSSAVGGGLNAINGLWFRTTGLLSLKYMSNQNPTMIVWTKWDPFECTMQKVVADISYTLV